MPSPVIAERIGDVEHLLERGDAAAIGRIHRMHRFERERHPARPRMRQYRGQSLDEHRAARRGKIARTRREAAADHHDAFGADRGGLVDHPLVVVDRGAQTCRARRPRTGRRGNSR